MVFNYCRYVHKNVKYQWTPININKDPFMYFLLFQFGLYALIRNKVYMTIVSSRRTITNILVRLLNRARYLLFFFFLFLLRVLYHAYRSIRLLIPSIYTKLYRHIISILNISSTSKGLINMEYTYMSRLRNYHH